MKPIPEKLKLFLRPILIPLLRPLERCIRYIRTTKKDIRHAMVGAAKYWKMKRRFQIAFLKRKGLRPEHYLLDIGCGTLRGGLPVIAYLIPGHYFGIEVRKDVLEEGRKELSEARLTKRMPVLLHAEDLSKLKIDQKFDYIWAFSVLIHMSDDILDKTLALVSRQLKDHGVFYGNVNIGQKNDSHWQGFPVVWRTLEFYQNKCHQFGLAVTDLGQLVKHGHISNVEAADSQRMLKIYKDKNHG